MVVNVMCEVDEAACRTVERLGMTESAFGEVKRNYADLQRIKDDAMLPAGIDYIDSRQIQVRRYLVLE